MKTPVLAILGAATLLCGCQGLPIADACNDALRAASGLQDVIAILERDFHLSHEKAASWGAIIVQSRDNIEKVCRALNPPPPVAVPGQ